MSGILKRKFEEVEASSSPCSSTRESDDEVSCSESGDSSDSVNPSASGPITPNSILKREKRLRTRRVHFENVTVYYFNRRQGFTSVPSQGGSTLGMSNRHSWIRQYSLGDFALEQERIHRDMLRDHLKEEKLNSVKLKLVLVQWRFTFYLYVFTYGVCFLKKTPWLWNTRECWYNYPYQPLSVDIHYYYILELSFYLSLLFSQFTDMRRKDFLIMFLHHLATISLITFSYVNNMARVGTLVMCLHDAADVLMEAAKMANYAKCQRLCNLLFAMFAILFISSRLGLYPIWILNTTLFESWEIVGPYPSWWVFNLLLFMLQLLHSFWAYLIVKIGCRAISRGKAGKWNPLHVSKDDRSDIESSSDEDDSPPPNQKHHNSTTNGTNKAHGTNGYLTGATCPDEH
ncbi:ceramide synthase 6 [Aplochiton taeniatus]